MSVVDPRRSIVCVGVSHKTAPVEQQECLAHDRDSASRVTCSLPGPAIDEALVLSTCNRAEAYVVGGDPAEAAQAALDALARYANRRDLAAVAYRHADREAVTHLFGVAASLDSMVVGETQILAQIRSALETAAACGAGGPVLDRLFRQALETGERVHTETSIGRRPVSVGSAAVQLAAETPERTLHRLDDADPRTVDEVRQLADRLGDKMLHLPRVLQHRRTSDTTGGRGCPRKRHLKGSPARKSASSSPSIPCASRR